jgi:hypothetical protein
MITFDKDHDNPIGFVEFALDRRGEVDWVGMDWNRTILHLGPGKKEVEGAINIDYPEYDFDKPGFQLPHASHSIGGVVATHVLEHLAHPVYVIREVARVLADHCPFNIMVPHGLSLMQLQDLDHKKQFILDTWKILMDNAYYDTYYGGSPIPLRIGANFKFAVKEGNECVVTQLIKTTP